MHGTFAKLRYLKLQFRSRVHLTRRFRDLRRFTHELPLLFSSRGSLSADAAPSLRWLVIARARARGRGISRVTIHYIRNWFLSAMHAAAERESFLFFFRALLCCLMMSSCEMEEILGRCAWIDHFCLCNLHRMPFWKWEGRGGEISLFGLWLIHWRYTGTINMHWDKNWVIRFKSERRNGRNGWGACMATLMIMVGNTTTKVLKKNGIMRQHDDLNNLSNFSYTLTHTSVLRYKFARISPTRLRRHYTLNKHYYRLH